MNIKITAATFVLALGLLLSAGLAQAANGYYTISANTPIFRSLGYGSTGSDVSKLQTFLASNSDIYPAGLVTGYYGPLTQAAVRQYQLSYGISTVGVVGPITMASVNNTMARQYGIDVYGPAISGVSVQTTNHSATVSWNTVRPASGTVFYSTNPLGFTEAIGNFSKPWIGGSSVSATSLQTSQTVVISGLQPNTKYYYIIQASDASGNVSVTGQSSFITN